MPVPKFDLMILVLAGCAVVSFKGTYGCFWAEKRQNYSGLQRTRKLQNTGLRRKKVIALLSISAVWQNISLDLSPMFLPNPVIPIHGSYSSTTLRTHSVSQSDPGWSRHQ